MREIDRAREALFAIPSDLPRDEWVRAGIAAKAAGLSFDDFNEWSSPASNYKSEADVRSVWNSFKADGAITTATLYRKAAEHGYRWRSNRSDKPRMTTHITRQRPQEAPKSSGKGGAPSFDFVAVWRDSVPATGEHGYVRRKLGQWDGLRVYRGPAKVAGLPLDGALLVPAYDAAGELQSWQAIPAEPGAKKLNAPGASMAGARFIVGGDVRDGDVYLCEGIGCAWSVHQASSKPAVCCFGAGNVERVAADLHSQHPAARVVVVADRGKEKQSERIARSVGGAFVALPDDWPANSDANDVHERDGLEAVGALLATAKAPAQRYRLLSADELAALPPMRWRVRGVLPAEGIGAIFGPSGSGKSFLVLDMLGAVADSREWFGHRTEAVPVTYLALEAEAGIAQRVNAYRTRHGATPARMRFVAQSFALLLPEDVNELAEAIRAAGGAGGIVAIDTLNRASPGTNENDSADMGAVIDGAKALQAALGGFVLLVHHSGKDAGKGLRGHSSLHAALDAVIEVSRDGDRREWKVAKSKDGADGEGHPFRLDVVELGADDEGEPVTSCVVRVDDSPQEATRPKLPRGGNQRVVYDALGPLLRKSPHFGMAGAPPGRPCVELEATVQAIAPSLAVEPKRRVERARQAITGLLTSGNLVCREGWLWHP